MREAIGGAADVALGVIGVGRWGRHWARVCNDVLGGRLVALCDSNPARRPDLPAAAQSAAWYSSAEQMVAEADLDAVVIATPTTSHAPLALLALDRGRHVLVEKPLAANELEA